MLGWHRADEGDARGTLRFRPPEEVRLTPAQRATAWYFLVVAGLFLLPGAARRRQCPLPRGARAASTASPLGRLVPLQPHAHVARAAGAVLRLGQLPGHGHLPRPDDRRPGAEAPGQAGHRAVRRRGRRGGRQPARRGGQPAGHRSRVDGPWFWIGAQGWEYLDLGRLWQILLDRRDVLLGGHPRPRAADAPARASTRATCRDLFLYSALSIPLFYAAGMVFGKNVELRRGGLLAVLGGAPVGRGFPGAVHHHHGRLHLRAAGRGAARRSPRASSTWTSSSIRSAA